MSQQLANTNIHTPVATILADPKHVHPNVESFRDTRTMAKVIACYCKVDVANTVNAINRADITAQRANFKQNLRANLTAIS